MRSAGSRDKFSIASCRRDVRQFNQECSSNCRATWQKCPVISSVFWKREPRFLNSSHINILNSSHINILNSSHINILNSSHINILNSSHTNILNSSHINILNSSHINILNSSHISILLIKLLLCRSCSFNVLFPLSEFMEE